jgi:predicted DNA-binding transcriptional regulator AlpA
MTAVTITQITPNELELIIENCLLKILRNQMANNSTSQIQEIQKKQFLNIDDASTVLGLSKTTVYALVSKKQIPVRKASNKRLYFIYDELIAYKNLTLR